MLVSLLSGLFVEAAGQLVILIEHYVLRSNYHPVLDEERQ